MRSNTYAKTFYYLLIMRAVTKQVGSLRLHTIYIKSDFFISHAHCNSIEFFVRIPKLKVGRWRTSNKHASAEASAAIVRIVNEVCLQIVARCLDRQSELSQKFAVKISLPLTAVCQAKVHPTSNAKLSKAN